MSNNVRPSVILFHCSFPFHLNSRHAYLHWQRTW